MMRPSDAYHDGGSYGEYTRESERYEPDAPEECDCDRCDCGEPAQWFGDTRGLRLFACKTCAKQEGARV